MIMILFIQLLTFSKMDNKIKIDALWVESNIKLMHYG